MSPQSDWGHLLSLFLNWVKGTAWGFFLCSTWAHTVSSSRQLWCHGENNPKTPSGSMFWTSGETQRDSIVASIGMNALVMLTEILLTIEWIWIDYLFLVCVCVCIYEHKTKKQKTFSSNLAPIDFFKCYTLELHICYTLDLWIKNHSSGFRNSHMIRT